jgi:hypothetical protein
LNGQDGPQGFAGPVGQTGQNIPGPQGMQGNSGGNGTQGFPGNTGPRGPQGLLVLSSPGPQGNLGSQGGVTQDEIALNGTLGSQGPFGFQGDQGQQGNAGFRGPQGATGGPGPQGPLQLGPQGFRGVQGFPADNALLFFGPQGYQAEIVFDGPQGFKGPQGPQSAGPTGPLTEFIWIPTEVANITGFQGTPIAITGGVTDIGINGSTTRAVLSASKKYWIILDLTLSIPSSAIFVPPILATVTLFYNTGNDIAKAFRLLVPTGPGGDARLYSVRLETELVTNPSGSQDLFAQIDTTVSLQAINFTYIEMSTA